MQGAEIKAACGCLNFLVFVEFFRKKAATFEVEGPQDICAKACVIGENLYFHLLKRKEAGGIVLETLFFSLVIGTPS